MTELPPPRLPDIPGLAFRPLVPADIDAWYALVKRIFVAEEQPWHETRSDLDTVFASSKNDPRQNTLAGIAEDGTLRAWARVTKNPEGDKAHAMGGVDPQWRRRGVGRALLRWQEEQVRRRFAEDGAGPARMRVHTEENNPGAAALLGGAGFSVVRHFYSMIRPLDTIPEPVLDDGLRIEPFTLERSEAVRLAHNEAFADHWGSEPRDAEAWGFFLADENLRTDWSSVAIDTATGEVAGYQLSSYDPTVLDTEGRREGYTDVLGVRRPWRGRRLAAALLIDAMKKFRADGMDSAALDVDTENPSGALGVYQRLGYREIRRSLAWDKVLDV